MASPFSVFRRHQKAMLAVVGILAMIAFVVLPPFFDSAGNQSSRNEVVVTTKYGDIREAELDGMIRSRQIANNFLEALIRRTIIVMREEGRLPFTDFQAIELFRRSLQNQWMLMEPTEASVVENMVLARKAEEMGLVVSDDTINQFIARQTDNKVSADELRGIVESMRISQRQLFSALRTELLAARLREMFEDTLAGSTPAQRWENYLRFKRRATIEAMAVPVADFADQVKAPDDATLIAFFEKYKDRIARPGSAEPGFHQPRQGKFQYFKADYEALSADVTVTDEEIAQFYEENKENFRLRRQTMPAEVMRELDQEAAEEGISAEGGTPAEGTTEESPTGETPTDEPAPEGSAEQSAEGATSPNDAGNEATPQDQPSSQAEDNQEGNAGDSESSSGDAATETPADESTSDELSNSGDMSQEADTEETTEAPSDTPSEPASEPESEPASEPMTEASEDAAEPSTPAGESPKPDDEAAGAQEGESTLSEGEPATTPFSPPPIPEHTLPDEWALPRDIRDMPDWEYQPLWMVKDRIRTALERQKAAEMSNQIFDGLVEAMNAYSEKWLDWLDEVAENPAAKQPPRPNFTRLAEGKPVTAHETGLITAQEALDTTDIGRSYVNNNTPFVRAAFEQTRLFVPGRSEDLEGNRYLFWKIEEVEDHIPEFADVRDKVLREWQMVEARPLAVEAAQKLVERARAASNSLEFVATSDGKSLINAGPFSWLTFGSAEPLSFQQATPRLSEVDGIEMAGPEFMRRVFTLNEGELGVALNEPQSIAYAVRVKSFEPSEVVLKETFLTDNYRRYESGAIYERREMYVAWLDRLNDEAGVDWVRAPDQPIRR